MSGFTCRCNLGFTGSRCEVDIGEGGCAEGEKRRKEKKKKKFLIERKKLRRDGMGGGGVMVVFIDELSK